MPYAYQTRRASTLSFSLSREVRERRFHEEQVSPGRTLRRMGRNDVGRRRARGSQIGAGLIDLGIAKAIASRYSPTTARDG